jgi:hypothetical protein
MDSKKIVKKDVKKDDVAIGFEKAHALDRFLKNPFNLSMKNDLKKFYKLKTLVVRSSVESNKFDLVIDMKTLDGNFKKVASKQRIELFEIQLPIGEKYLIKAIRRNMFVFKNIESRELVLKDDMEVEF